MKPLPHKNVSLSGWGHSTSVNCVTYRPEKQRDLTEVTTPLLARGCGRAYGDAALQPHATVLMERLNRMLHFDESHGLLTAEAGVTLAEIIDVFAPRGWLPPVIPGTKHVSLGGAFACNIHGKNHFQAGEFAEHVRAVTLLLADGTRRICMPGDELFQATAGGMGLTGIIEEITLQLRPIASLSLKSWTRKTLHLADMIEAFRQGRDHADYMVGWIDHVAPKDEFGRGIFEAARHITVEEGGAALEEYTPAGYRFTVPFTLPGFVLNRYSMALYNGLRFRNLIDRFTESAQSFGQFFHPLDRINHWYRLYGRRGFFQYQCIIPEHPDNAAQIEQLLRALQERGLFSFLAVIKYHREGIGHLTFSMRGYSLALDFPNTAKVRAFLPQLNEMVLALGGRVYLAKDATLDAATAERMYAHALPAWRDVAKQVNPDGGIDSALNTRLKLL